MPKRIKEAVAKLREIRRQWGISNIEDIQWMTRDKLGPDLVMQFPQLGRIERGILKRPPNSEDLAILGMMYGMTPAEMFKLYGLPVYGVSLYEKRTDPRVQRLEEVVASIPEDSPVRERLLKDVIYAIIQAQDALERQKAS